MLVIISARFPIDGTAEGQDAIADLGRQIQDVIGRAVEAMIIDGEAVISVSYRVDDTPRERELAETTRTKIAQILSDEELDDVGIEPILFY